MNNELLRACEQGLILSNGATGDRFVVDFIATGRNDASVVLATVSGWWTVPWFEMQVGVRYGLGEVRRHANGSWTIQSTSAPAIQLLPLMRDEDGAENDVEALDQSRLAMDTQRELYLENLRVLARAYPSADLIPWKNYIDQRKTINLAEWSERQRSLARKVATLLLVDNSGTVVDTLVYDERGEFATASLNWWMVAMGRNWAMSHMTQTIDDFHASVLENSIPYGPFSLRDGGVVLRPGTIESFVDGSPVYAVA